VVLSRAAAQTLFEGVEMVYETDQMRAQLVGEGRGVETVGGGLEAVKIGGVGGGEGGLALALSLFMSLNSQDATFILFW
jgi:hypothetical protein